MSSAPAVRIPEPPANMIDRAILNEVLEMDPEGTFVPGLVKEWREQALDTFAKLDAALAAGELDALSQLGHFLKGSSASLGIARVRQTCAAIQQVGHCHAPDGSVEMAPADALLLIKELIGHARQQFAEAIAHLQDELQIPLQ